MNQAAEAIVEKKLPNEPTVLVIRTMLVAVDLSAESMRSLECAIPIARRFGSALHLLYVHEGSQRIASGSMAQLLHEMAETRIPGRERQGEDQVNRSYSIEPNNCHVVTGRSYTRICEFARDRGFDLVVISTRGQTGFSRITLGSTAERVLQFAPCPVLVTRQRRSHEAVPKEVPTITAFAPQEILVPVDFSACSLAGVRYAALLAKAFKAKLHLLHVMLPTNPVLVNRIGASLFRESNREQLANARMEMEALSQLSFMKGIACDVEIRTGYAIEEICAEVGRVQAEMVVTSTHGQTGWKRAILGSVAEQIVRYAQRPVLVVPARLKDSA